MKNLNKIFFSALFFFFLNFIHSEEINRGLVIAEKADESFSGYGDSKTTLKMMLKDRKGLVTERVMEMRLLEILEDGDKSLIIINNPRDLRGYAVLSHAHKVGTDDQWLYIPALKRVKRVASKDVPVAYSAILEDQILVQTDWIIDVIKEVVEY